MTLFTNVHSHYYFNSDITKSLDCIQCLHLRIILALFLPKVPLAHKQSAKMVFYSSL